MNTIKRFIRDDSGQDMVEYGLLAGFVSLVAIAALVNIGPEIERIFNAILKALQKA